MVHKRYAKTLTKYIRSLGYKGVIRVDPKWHSYVYTYPGCVRAVFLVHDMVGLVRRMFKELHHSYAVFARAEEAEKRSYPQFEPWVEQYLGLYYGWYGKDSKGAAAVYSYACDRTRGHRSTV